MKNLHQIIGIILCSICGILVSLLWFTGMPYKEILKCNNGNCSVERLYLLNFKNYTYYANSKDLYIRRLPRIKYWKHSYQICDNTDLLDSLFVNTFLIKNDAQKILDTIRTNTNVHIIKYMTGYKIVNRSGFSKTIK